MFKNVGVLLRCHRLRGEAHCAHDKHGKQHSRYLSRLPSDVSAEIKGRQYRASKNRSRQPEQTFSSESPFRQTVGL